MKSLFGIVILINPLIRFTIYKGEPHESSVQGFINMS